MTHLTLIEIAQIINFVIQAERDMAKAIDPCASVLFEEK